MQPLADAARCRSEADWLVGINGTRAMTAFNSRDGGFFLTTVGRVQTPTLAVVVEREEQIRKFISRDYWEIHATFLRRGRRVPGQVVRPAWKKDARRRREEGRPRLDRSARPRPLPTPCAARRPPSPKKASPPPRPRPLLFDLTSLQREANGKFGFSRQDHAGDGAKPVRAPQGPDLPAYRFARPARRLPAGGQADLRDAGRQRHAAPGAACAHGAQQRLHQAQQAHLRQRQGQRSLCHHPHAAGAQRPERGRAEAVRPGGAPLHGGVLPQRRIPWSPPASRTAVGHSFKTEGKVLVKPGWLAIYGKEAADEVADAKDGDKGQSLVPVQARREGARRSRWSPRA